MNSPEGQGRGPHVTHQSPNQIVSDPRGTILWGNKKFLRVIVPRRRTHLRWGESSYSIEKVNEGFSRISGITGSGKTHLVKLFVWDILEELETNPHAKLVLYEPKREFFAWLSSLSLKTKISYFMPSDSRGVALDFTEDYRDDIDAQTLSHAFWPEASDGKESPFWGKSMRTIYSSVYTAIREKLSRADMRLVCLVLEDEGLTRKVLDYDPYMVQARTLAGLTGKSETETATNIQYTIQSRIGEMKVTAAHLDCASREKPLFSLRKFIKEEGSGILVISKDSTYGVVQDPINAVLFHRFTQLLDKEQSDHKRKIYVIIDEFPTLNGENPCPGVKDMFLRLRSRGAVPLITDQGLTTLKPIYKDNTTAILGQCSNVIILKQPDIESAEDSAKNLGKERGYEKKASVSYGGEYATISQSNHWFDRTIIEASRLQDLSPASPVEGIQGVAKTVLDKEKKPRPFTIPPEEVDEIPERNPGVEEYVERDSKSQRLRKLEPDERRGLEREGTHEEEGGLWADYLTK